MSGQYKLMQSAQALLVLLCLSGIQLNAHAQEEEEPKPQRVPMLMALESSEAAVAAMDPEAMKARMRVGMAMYSEQARMRLEAMSDPETAKLLAKFSRAYYEALVAEGFTEEEAMRLVIAVGVPSDR